MSPAAKLTKIDKALKAKADQSAYLTDDEKTEIRICAGTACHASGRVALRKAVEKTLAERGLTDKVAVVETGCHGFCEEGAIVVVRPQGLFYPRLKPKDIEEVIATSVVATASSSGCSTRTRRRVRRSRTRRRSRSTRCRTASSSPSTARSTRSLWTTT